jgi:hypothetical protein
MDRNIDKNLSLKMCDKFNDEMTICENDDIGKIVEWNYNLYIFFSEQGCKKIKKLFPEIIGKKLSFYVNDQLIFNNYYVFPEELNELFGTITKDSKCICVQLIGAVSKIEFLKGNNILLEKENLLSDKIIINKQIFKETKHKEYEMIIINFFSFLLNKDDNYKKLLYEKNKKYIENEIEEFIHEIDIIEIAVTGIYHAYINESYWIEINIVYKEEIETIENLFTLTIEKIDNKWQIINFPIY